MSFTLTKPRLRYLHAIGVEAAVIAENELLQMSFVCWTEGRVAMVVRRQSKAERDIFFTKPIPEIFWKQYGTEL